MAYHGAHIAAAAAEKKQRQLEAEEEEKMTKYSSDDMDKWEFKIVRSESGAFRKTEVLADLVDEEALAGWEMLEKFDNKRIRFRRPIDARKNDHNLPDYIDPYRTQYGTPSQMIAVAVAVGVLLLGILVAVFVGLRGAGDFSFDSVAWGEISVILFLVIGVGIAAVAVAFARARG
ncbi:MAG: hypothetical protein ABFS03_07195 [Chloroflexota bacterium]